MNQEKLRTIIDFAIEGEKEAAKKYSDLMENEHFEDLNYLIVQVRDTEEKHAKILQEIKEKGVFNPSDYQMELVSQLQDFVLKDEKISKLLDIFIVNESKAVNLYTELSEYFKDDPETLKVFEYFRQEEISHKEFFESLKNN